MLIRTIRFDSRTHI